MCSSKITNVDRPTPIRALFKDRLKTVIGTASIRSFATQCGLSEGVLRNYLRGDTLPTLDRLEAIASAASVNKGWLATGEGSRHSNLPFELSINGGSVMVPHYNVQGEQIAAILAFSCSWLHDMGLQQDKLFLITGSGDSMEPTIKREDILLVETVNTAAVDGIYALRIDKVLQIKRLIINPIDGSVTIKSDNCLYPPITVQKEDIDPLQIAGRVVWIGGRSI